MMRTRWMILASLCLALWLPVTAHATVLGTDACGGTGDLGANWTVVTGFEMPQQGSGVCQAKTLAVAAFAIYSAVAWPNDQYVQIKVVAADTSNLRINYGLLRFVSTARTGYECNVRGPLGATTTLTIIRYNAGTPTTLVGGTAIYTVAANDTMYCEIQGSTVTMKINGATVLGPTVDGTPIASGSAGVGAFVQSGSLAGAQLDDWVGGDFASVLRGQNLLLEVGR